MGDFTSKLESTLRSSIWNNYGVRNYDEQRFGKFPEVNTNNSNPRTRLIKAYGNLKLRFKKLLDYRADEYTKLKLKSIEKYTGRLQSFYELLPKEDRSLLIAIVAYRLLGYKKVMLPRNNKEYWKSLAVASQLKVGQSQYDPRFLHYKLDKYNLSPIGYDISLFLSEAGVAIDFILEQYACKIAESEIIAVKKGDVVFELGACWGDTALYFAEKAKEDGKVFSFEFIPGNIKLFNINMAFNPKLKERIQLLENPVSMNAGETVYFKDFGPGSQVRMEPFPDQAGTAVTVSIDQFVKDHKIDKVDFIKMDIEGAELPALKGALATMRKFKPDLAIAIYHSWEDLVHIPLWLASQQIGYRFYLRHYTIHSEETILFATCRK